jgi:hypothetical protein
LDIGELATGLGLLCGGNKVRDYIFSIYNSKRLRKSRQDLISLMIIMMDSLTSEKLPISLLDSSK